MDRGYRSDRAGDVSGGGGGGRGGGRHQRMPSRWSSDSPTGPHHRYHRGGGGGGGGGGRGGGGWGTGGDDGFSGGGGWGDSGGSGRHHPYRNPNDYPPPRGGGGGPGFGGGPGGFGNQMHMAGPRSGRGYSDREASNPDFSDDANFVRKEEMSFPRSGDRDHSWSEERNFSRGEERNFAKLFVGSVPRTATEEEIRPLFEKHGQVLEVALIKDKRTGQQQGFCFVKYTTPEEADRAIRALHNQYTLPGESAPLQVRYADSERERLGAIEPKLFVGALNRLAGGKEIEEIFAPYGHVEDVYIMRDEHKQNRGCAFVKFSNRDMAFAAQNALHEKYIMRGCDKPLIVRFADPKRTRPGEPRGGPAFGGPGFGPRPQMPFGDRPRFNEPMGGRMTPNSWNPGSPQSVGLPSQAVPDGCSIHLAGKGGVMGASSIASDMMGFPGGSVNGSFPGIVPKPPSQAKPLASPQPLLPSLQMPQPQQASGSHLQAQPLQAPMPPFGQFQINQPASLSNQGPPSQQFPSLCGQPSSSQPLVQQCSSVSAQQSLLGVQQQMMPSASNQQQLSAPMISQLLQQPIQQLPAHLSQALLHHQAQALQSSVQSNQQGISQLQQQVQLMQQQTTISQRQGSHSAKLQQQWPVVNNQVTSSNATGTSVAPIPSAVSSAQQVAPLSCNWSEHTSPEGYKYYYNSVSKESKWEKPEDYIAFEQQQQQEQQLKMLQMQQHQQQLQQQQLQQLKVSAQHLQSSSELLSNSQISSQQASQMQQPHTSLQLNHPAQLHLHQHSLPYQASAASGPQNILDVNYSQLQASSVTYPAQNEQGMPHEWMLKNRPAGS